MPKTLALALSLAVIGAVTAHADTAALSLTHSFVQNATISNHFDISSSRLALQNSHNEAVKNFARQMVVAHSDIAAKMKKAMADGHIGMMDSMPGLDAKHQGLLDQLNDLKDNAFDQQYMDDELALHKATISLFHYYATRGDNESLKEFAENILPSLKQQQEDLRALRP